MVIEELTSSGRCLKECEMYTEPSLEVDQNTATIAGSAICAIVTCYVSQNINWQSGAHFVQAT